MAVKSNPSTSQRPRALGYVFRWFTQARRRRRRSSIHLPKGEKLKYVFQILFKVSNNEAEYEALLHGRHLAVSLGIKRLLVYGNSLLVVQQVNKEWDINKDTMDAYVEEIRKFENKFSGLEIYHVDCDNNMGAMSCPNLDLLEQLSHLESLSMNYIFLQSR